MVFKGEQIYVYSELDAECIHKLCSQKTVFSSLKQVLYEVIHNNMGRATAQTVTCRLPTAAVRV
jgi:hypothetical protein